MIFDSKQHLHIGYYENDLDIEAIAYKIKSEDKWIVFLDSEQDLNMFKDTLNQLELYENYGYKIFSVEVDDLSYEYGLEKFTEWLKVNKVV
ncbi:DUF3986 family protein [Rossellomorea aquimaris]|uniref:DUF3986 family protein n=1 Tax=Rossellomorea aquimaris TaxID=189382 RepID=A0A5D4UHZ1_9BACI|nr:DUF3986 family protein [Rossellomorea aquimaris]TYS77579.1 DUF3986 family protein [Rossellomorea aquimaris]TYS86761.1 DUF3986 family protein [Rossellomorea aquimaris]